MIFLIAALIVFAYIAFYCFVSAVFDRSMPRMLIAAFALVLAIGLPLLALAQEAAPLVQFDPVAIVQALPLGAGAKAGILFALPLVYIAAVFARGFTSPSSRAGRVVRVVLDGWKHPDERSSAGSVPPSSATMVPAKDAASRVSGG